MANKQFGKGCVVQLASGGPKMTVADHYTDYNKPGLYGTDTVKCVWFDSENNYREGKFPVESVVWIE